MTTIANLKQNVNLSEIKKNMDDFLVEILKDNDIIELHIQALVKSFFNKNSSLFGNANFTRRKFDNEIIIELLENSFLYTTNSFVKNVILTVSKSKQFSDKQIDIISEEISKMNQFEITL